MQRGVIGEKLGWRVVDKKSGGKESFIPIFKKHGSMGEQCKSHLHNMVMFTLGRTILLVSVRA
jgi:hypothetical protein